MATDPLLRFTARHEPGFVLDATWPLQAARKREVAVDVVFADAPGQLQTLEGEVGVRVGDAIVTGPAGERWRVSAEHFGHRYRAAGTPGRFISRPHTVRVMRLATACEVLLSDGHSRLHGRPGDWLVDYGDGSLGIVAAHLFDRTYEVL